MLKVIKKGRYITCLPFLYFHHLTSLANLLSSIEIILNQTMKSLLIFTQLLLLKLLLTSLFPVKHSSIDLSFFLSLRLTLIY